MDQHILSCVTDEPVDKARALQELAEWPLLRDEMPLLRAARMAAAWRAGHRNLALLARTADVSRNTAYDDLRSVGIDPADIRQKEESSVSITALKAQSARTRLLRHMQKLFADDQGMEVLAGHSQREDMSDAEHALQWAWCEALVALHGLPRASAVYAEYAKDRQRAEAEKRPPVGSWDSVCGAPPDHWDRDIHGYLCLICGGYHPVLWTKDYGAICKRCAKSGEWDDLTPDSAWPLWKAASHERFLFGGVLRGEMPKGPRTVSFNLGNGLDGEDLAMGEAALLYPDCSKLQSLVGLKLVSLRAQGQDVASLDAVAEATVEHDGRSFDIIASFTYDPRPEGFEQHPYGFRFTAGRLTGAGAGPAATAEYTDVYELIGALLTGLFDTAA